MNTHSQHTPQKSVGRHPDRPAHGIPARVSRGQTEEPSDDTAGGFLSILRGYPIVLAVTALSALVFVTAACLAAWKSPDPTALILPASAIAQALASLVGGMTAGKLNPSNPLSASLLCGGLTAILITLLSMVFGGEGGLISWAMRLGGIPLHLVGGILTRPRKKAPTHTAGKHPSRR